MISIIATNIVKEENLESYKQLVEELAKKSNEEDGCILYTCMQSKEDRRIHKFVEYWKNQDAIDFHVETEHFKTIVPKLGNLLEEEGTIELFNVIT